MPYLKKIIENYIEAGIQTVTEAKLFNKQYTSKKSRILTKKNNQFITSSSTPAVPSEFYYDWMNE